MSDESWDEYLGQPAALDASTDLVPDPAATEPDWENWNQAAPDEMSGDLQGYDVVGADDSGVDAVALAETELADDSTEIISASTTDGADTVHDWTTDAGGE